MNVPLPFCAGMWWRCAQRKKDDRMRFRAEELNGHVYVWNDVGAKVTEFTGRLEGYGTKGLVIETGGTYNVYSFVRRVHVGNAMSRYDWMKNRYLYSEYLGC